MKTCNNSRRDGCNLKEGNHASQSPTDTPQTSATTETTRPIHRQSAIKTLTCASQNDRPGVQSIRQPDSFGDESTHGVSSVAKPPNNQNLCQPATANTLRCNCGIQQCMTRDHPDGTSATDCEDCILVIASSEHKHIVMDIRSAQSERSSASNTFHHIASSVRRPPTRKRDREHHQGAWRHDARTSWPAHEQGLRSG